VSVGSVRVLDESADFASREGERNLPNVDSFIASAEA
jgi:hypothetical protein